jgi:hypothetical protein
MRLKHVRALAGVMKRKSPESKQSNVASHLNRKQRRRFEAKKREATKEIFRLAKEQLKKHPLGKDAGEEYHEEVRVESEVSK